MAFNTAHLGFSLVTRPPLPRWSQQLLHTIAQHHPHLPHITPVFAGYLNQNCEWQLQQIPHHTKGTPPKFFPHPLRFIDHKAQARIHKQAVGKTPEQAKPGMRWFMDFGFMRASTSDYTTPNTATDQVVTSFDGFNAYLLIINDASWFIWVFLRNQRSPQLTWFPTSNRFTAANLALLSAVTKAENSHDARLFARQCWRNTRTLLNPQVQTALPKMRVLRNGTTHLRSLFALSLGCVSPSKILVSCRYACRLPPQPSSPSSPSVHSL